jgi:sulfur carrier protein ThiS
MKLHLGGYLSWYAPERRSWIEVPLREPTALLDVVRQLGIPAAEISVASVNGAMVHMADARVADADCVELHPPLPGG